MGLVDDDEIGSGGQREIARARIGHQILEREDGARMLGEGVVVVAAILEHIVPPGRGARPRARRQQLPIEEDEDLVKLPIELAQPLHGQRGGRDDHDPLRTAGAPEPVQDHAGFDRLPEPDLIGEKPAHRVGRHRHRGHVQLMGEDADPPAEERSRSLAVPEAHELSGGDPRLEIGEPLALAAKQALGEIRARNLVPALRIVTRRQGERYERVIAEREGEGLAGAREVDPHPVSLDRLDEPGAELAIVLVEHLVAGLERRRAVGRRGRSAAVRQRLRTTRRVAVVPAPSSWIQ